MNDPVAVSCDIAFLNQLICLLKDCRERLGELGCHELNHCLGMLLDYTYDEEGDNAT